MRVRDVADAGRTWRLKIGSRYSPHPHTSGLTEVYVVRRACDILPGEYRTCHLTRTLIWHGNGCLSLAKSTVQLTIVRRSPVVGLHSPDSELILLGTTGTKHIGRVGSKGADHSRRRQTHIPVGPAAC